MKHKARFAHVSMLTRSKFVQVTAELVRLYTDEKAFDEALATSTASKA